MAFLLRRRAFQFWAKVDALTYPSPPQAVPSNGDVSRTMWCLAAGAAYSHAPVLSSSVHGAIFLTLLHLEAISCLFVF